MLLWKIYFGIMVFLTVFSGYFQLSITQNYNIFDLINLVANIVLLVGTYSYIFKKKITEVKKWKWIFKGLVVLIAINLLHQIMPSSYLGDFSLLNGSLLTNIFVYLLILVFYIPLYYAVYKLGFEIKNLKKKSK